MAILAALGTSVAAPAPFKTKGKSNQDRSPADIAQKRAKQAAKRARRAARAGHKVQP